MTYYQSLKDNIKDTRESCVFEIKFGESIHNYIFKFGIIEDEFKPILKKIIHRYGKPHYYRSTNLYHDDLELSNSGKNRCYQKIAHDTKIISGIGDDFDIECNKIVKKKINSNSFPNVVKYHHLETTENATFEIRPHLKLIVFHNYQPTTETYTKLYYGIKLVYLHQSPKDQSQIQILENKIRDVSEAVSAIMTFND